MLFRKMNFRELKHGALRYLLLFLVIALGITLIVGLGASADSVTSTVTDHTEKNRLEDGDFSVLVPLTENQLKEIESNGTIIEPQFYVDMNLEDNSVIRVYQNRSEVNLIELDYGNPSVNDNEIVLEKHYAEEHKLKVNSTLTIGNNEYVVVGVGSVPDYDNVLRNITDMLSDEEYFGVGFVNENTYKELEESNSGTSEEYSYAYIFEDEKSQKDFKTFLQQLQFDKSKITNKYILEMLSTMEEERDEIDESVGTFTDGINELGKSVHSLAETGEDIEDVVSGLFDNVLDTAQLQLNGYGFDYELNKSNYGQQLDQILLDFPNNSELELVIQELRVQLDNYNEFYEGIVEYFTSMNELDEATEELNDGVVDVEELINDLADEVFDIEYQNLTSFITQANNPRILASVEDVEVNKIFSMYFGIIYMILMSYVISVFMSHNIDQQSAVIGTLYSMGHTKKNLLWSFMIVPIVVVFAGGLAGTVLGFLLIEPLGADAIEEFSFPIVQNVYSIGLILYGTILPVIVTVAVNFLMLNKRLSTEPLKLIKKQRKQTKISRVNLKNMSFNNKFRIRQLIREKQNNITLFFGLFFAIFLMVFGITVYTGITNFAKDLAKDVPYNYMYILKYAPKDVPKGGAASYIKTLDSYCVYADEDMSITLQGIAEENRYFDLKFDGKEDGIIISSSVAAKFQWKKGDSVTLTDAVEEKSYTFTINDVVQYGYGLYVFMDIDTMRDLFDQSDDYYNTVMSDEELTIDRDRISSIITSEDIEITGEKYLASMIGAVLVLMVISIVIFIVIMFLLIKMIIDKSTFSISLLKVLGYNEKNVRKLYLGSNFYTVVITGLIAVPVSKILVDKVFPYMVYNVAGSFDADFHTAEILIIAVIILLSYFMSSIILRRYLKKVSLTEILKERE